MPKRVDIDLVRGECVYVLVQPKAGQPTSDVRHDNHLIAGKSNTPGARGTVRHGKSLPAGAWPGFKKVYD
jgi:hypothetical protein